MKNFYQRKSSPLLTKSFWSFPWLAMYSTCLSNKSVFGPGDNSTSFIIKALKKLFKKTHEIMRTYSTYKFLLRCNIVANTWRSIQSARNGCMRVWWGMQKVLHHLRHKIANNSIGKIHKITHHSIVKSESGRFVAPKTLNARERKKKTSWTEPNKWL